MNRVVAYVDGFNLYFGLKRKGWKKHYWLDLYSLAESLLKPGQTLETVHYFTARIRSTGKNQDDMKRQSIYLDALSTRPNLFIHYGHFLEKNRKCHQCGARWIDYEEKMTDVNIAVQLLADASDNRFDTALLISADSDLTTPVQLVRLIPPFGLPATDSDLTTPVQLVRTRFSGKRVIVAQPPASVSVRLSAAATAAFNISETKVRQNQLPVTVQTANGYTLRRPDTWR
jgi:uncharacterized LabA/DUF88 family protein